jgi:signal transduction histidine kinase
LEIKSVLLLPVGKLDGWMGAIGLDETAVKRVWQEDDVQLMQTIARMLNTYIERQQSQEALAQAHDAALAASRFKSELLAKVSHELRTPLSAIKGYAQLLQLGSYGTLSTQQAEPIKLIISSTNFLTLLVNELLDQARLESNKLVLHDQIFSLRQMVADVEARMRVLAEHKGLLFASWIDPTLPEELVGDVTRLQQILTNLISNAIKFTQTGFVRVRIQAIWPDEWLLQVIDSGSGIPEEAHQTIFEPFGQVDGSATRLHSGTGLGLTISQQLAQLMGGTLILENTSGEGSIFSLRLPLRQFEYNVECWRWK